MRLRTSRSTSSSYAIAYHAKLSHRMNSGSAHTLPHSSGHARSLRRSLLSMSLLELIQGDDLQETLLRQILQGALGSGTWNRLNHHIELERIAILRSREAIDIAV